MYSTCIHCHAPLGANDTIERFPVGRRLAFDAARGRLWVVCERCRRWNLTPLEERWEAIEDCERRFRATRLRVSTDNIGLARLSSGLELVRIGNPQRPEIAVWRYAANLKRRWLAYSVPAAGVTGVALALQASQGLIGVGTALGSMAVIGGVGLLHTWWPRRARAALPDGRVVTIGVNQIGRVRLHSVGTDWGVAGLPHTEGVVTGPLAVHALRAVTTASNFRGAQQDVIDDAISLLSAAGDSSRFISRLARVSDRMQIHTYSPDVSVALEMALHEDAERKALDGELQGLRAEWAVAEEIAGLADDMFLSADVSSGIRVLKEAGP